MTISRILTNPVVGLIVISGAPRRCTDEFHCENSLHVCAIKNRVMENSQDCSRTDENYFYIMRLILYDVNRYQ